MAFSTMTRRILWILSALFLLTFGCRTVNPQDNRSTLQSSTVCRVGGIQIKAGASIDSSDGCNKCSCSSDGRLSCTELACSDRPYNGCKVGPVGIKLNAEVASSDGCNTCTCTEDGLLCTEIACPQGGNQDPRPNNAACKVGSVQIASGKSVDSSDGCNKCGCQNGRLSCTELACSDRPYNGCKVGPVGIKLNGRIASSDGCNTCTCTDRGLACTELACSN